MGVISVLASAVADQIAAGEVVERPASVVKELVENALDAGAKRVDVEIVGGGVDRLVVSDDGSGMDDDDAVLCFERHATSKLKVADDLRRIASFGFRGEALAAISSVAKVTLTTRRREKGAGFAVVVEGGRVVAVGEAGHAPGTRIDVRELFFNVPARRKFLKTLRTEAGHIEDTLLSTALSRPELGVRLVVDGKLVLDLPAVSDTALSSPARLDRVVRCLGKHLRPHLYPVTGQTELLSVAGYVVAPIETRRDLAGIHLSVNGRPVSDRQLVQAVRAAFRTLLEVGRQPIVALDVRLDPELVDVNVHPQKAEVRFADPRRVSGHVIALLSEFLVTTPWLDRDPRAGATIFKLQSSTPPLPIDPPASTSTSTSSSIVSSNAASNAASNAPSMSAPIAEARSTTATSEPDVVDAHRERVRAALLRFGQRNTSIPPTSTTWPQSPSSNSSPNSSPNSSSNAASNASSSPVFPTLQSQPGRGGASSFSSLRVVGQVGSTYLILEGPAGMVVIDQHAAHERVVFERLRARRQASSTSTQPSQPLLLPITIELSPIERAALDDDDVKRELLSWGLDVDGYAHTTALVRALPPGLDGKKAQAIVRDALAELGTSGTSTTLDDRIDAVCARLACHAAIRAGDVLAPAQVRALLEDLDRIDFGAHCPHGRPVVRAVDYSELAGWFDR
ncbi:MAG TPA: DNA mismatch repair endonuclease MutL [Myxococcota bacterium]